MPTNANPTDRRGRCRIKIWRTTKGSRNKMLKGNMVRHLTVENARVSELAAFWNYFLWSKEEGIYNNPIEIPPDMDEVWQEELKQLNEAIEDMKKAEGGDDAAENLGR